jgi:3-hydroxymyristoyl/3-hydroxydecanoyl-(acyl carrier protein) dehydratase
MIDRVLEHEAGRRIETIKTVTEGDVLVAGYDLAQGPSLPSAFLLEGMAQSAALLFRLSHDGSPDELPLLGWTTLSVRGAARPGDVVRFRVQASKMTRHGGVFDAEAHGAGTLLAQGQLAFAAAARPEAGPEGGRERCD